MWGQIIKWGHMRKIVLLTLVVIFTFAVNPALTNAAGQFVPHVLQMPDVPPLGYRPPRQITPEEQALAEKYMKMAMEGSQKSQRQQTQQASPPLIKAADVAYVQAALAQLGYTPGSADGVYGPRTEQAVIAFMRDKNCRPEEVAPLLAGEMHNLFMDRVPMTCANTPKDYIPICEGALRFQVTPRYYIATSVLANSEFAATKCRFMLVDNFNNIKNDILSSQNRKHIYDVLVQGKEIIEKPNNEWCKQEYQAWKGYGFLK